jgi:hypothetical protein
VAEWRAQTSADIVRSHPLRRLGEPLRDRKFTFAAYAAFLDDVLDSGVRTVRLRDFRSAPRDRPIFALRHDVDVRLSAAERLAELEHDRGIAATYFVLHTAPYWRRSDLHKRLRRLQDLGHEVGWHNDLVSVAVVEGVDPVQRLRRELEALRAAGIDVVGAAAHGSIWCHVFGFDNNALFEDFPEAKQPPHFVPQTRLQDFFEYEAYHLGEDVYYTDARFDERWHRWHPSLIDFGDLQPNKRAIALVHPDHWDRSVAAKFARLPGRLAAKASELALRRRVGPSDAPRPE